MPHIFFNPRWLNALRQFCRARAVLRWRATSAKQMERGRAAFYEAAWREAAGRLGAQFEDLGDRMYQMSLDGRTARVWCNYTDVDDPVTLMVAGNKPATFRLLKAAGVPVPQHETFTLETISRASQFLGRVGRPCVVKPAKDTGGGLGVTTGITSYRQLPMVAAMAAAYSRDMLIEEQIEGHNYRLLYLDGVLLDAVLRHPPAVVGDGQSTIGQLVRRENERRVSGGYAVSQFLLHRDADMRRTLARQGLSLRSVARYGQRIVVKTAVNENTAEETESALQVVSPQVRDSGAKAAAALGVKLAGVDVITVNPGVSLEESGGVVVEVNATPGMYYHYHQRGASYPVARVVLERQLLGKTPYNGARTEYGAEADGGATAIGGAAHSAGARSCGITDATNGF